LVSFFSEVALNREPAVNDQVTESGKSGQLKLVLIVGLILGLLVASRFVDIPGALKGALDWIEGLGVLGMVVFVVLYIVACIFVLPGPALTLGAGAIYGLPIGFALVSVGSTLGASCTFVIGRYFARDWVEAKVSSNKTFSLIDEAVAQQGWKIVFLTRLTPLIPFNIQNYGYGLTKVSLLPYAVASWIGMMPGTVLFTYVGTLGGEAAGGDSSVASWVMRGVALVATILVTVVITRIAKRALDEAVVTAD
jgi:uncharacterized membrane protein YdjX (TVP38/TMEM64 family)